MIPMRQRVLLVAGWVVAAAVTSLVASGAVAVAGGQVNDRPPSGVLAASVDALPVVDSEEPPSCEPLASGGSDCTTGDSSAGAQNERPGSSDGLDPVGGEDGIDDLRIDPGVSATESEDAEVPRPDAPALPVISTEGGSAGFIVVDDQVLVWWSVPRIGYRIQYDETDDPAIVRITFTSDTDQESIVARWRDGELTVETLLGE